MSLLEADPRIPLLHHSAHTPLKGRTSVTCTCPLPGESASPPPRGGEERELQHPPQLGRLTSFSPQLSFAQPFLASRLSPHRTAGSFPAPARDSATLLQQKPQQLLLWLSDAQWRSAREEEEKPAERWRLLSCICSSILPPRSAPPARRHWHLLTSPWLRALAGEPLLGAWQLVQGPGHLPPPFSRDVARQEWAWDKSLAREEEEEEEAHKARGALLPTAAERHFRQPVCRFCSSHEHRGPGKPIQARAKGRTHAERFCNTHKHRQARTRLSVQARCGRPSASSCRTVLVALLKGVGAPPLIFSSQLMQS